MHSNMLVLAFICLGYVLCRAQSLDPILDFCARWHHQSIVKSNMLYIDGGVESFKGDGYKVLGYNQYLIQVDMSDSWDWKTNITQRKVEKSENPSTGTFPPSLMRGAMFQGNNDDLKVYTYEGTSFLANTSFPNWEPPDSSTYALWSYDTSTQMWNQNDVTFASLWRPNRGAYAEAPGRSTAFWLNGQIDQGTSNLTYTTGENKTTYLEGMIVLNTGDQTARNVSTSSLGPARVGGGLHYIEVMGTKHFLLALGGMQKSVSSVESSDASGLVDFESVHLCDDFDEDQSTWYSQPTAGDIPEARIEFCTVIIAAPDNSSHNVYMYGGYDPTRDILYDDVYILSLPSFTWTKVFGPGESPRWGHTCHIVGKSQMLTVGGSSDASSYNIDKITRSSINASEFECDWELKGIAILDMSAIQWGSVFNAYKGSYQVPASVVSAIGGNKNGSATMTAPKNGFAEPAVSATFARNTSESEGSSGKGHGSNQSNTGAIAGGVVGGIVGLSLVVWGTYWSLLKRRKNRQVQDSHPLELDSGTSRYEMDASH